MSERPATATERSGEPGPAPSPQGPAPSPQGAAPSPQGPAPSGSLGDGLRTAVGTLTALRVPAPRRIDRRVGATAMLLAPVAGLIPGLAAAAVCWLGRAAGLGDLLAAGLAVGTVALTTRGLHLDGLADTADGLAASYDRERALAVMRRGDTGPTGAGALVLVMLVQVLALGRALDGSGPAAALVAVLAGRVVLPVACAKGVPAARPEGLGATLAEVVPRPAAALAVLVVAVGAFPLVGWRGPVAVAAAVLAAAALLRRAVSRLGGMSGDVLGACVEAGSTAALVALALHP